MNYPCDQYLFSVHPLTEKCMCAYERACVRACVHVIALSRHYLTTTVRRQFRLCRFQNFLLNAFPSTSVMRSQPVKISLADFLQIFVEGSWKCCSWSPSPATNVGGCELLVGGQLCYGFTWHAKCVTYITAQHTCISFDKFNSNNTRDK